ncbi:MAG: GlxA family transcriptional regulator [Pseudomonadota bacterium]
MSEKESRSKLSIGFVLARRFTLSAFANFVDVLRLAADERDRSRKIKCEWSVLSPTMAPVRSSTGISVQPDRRLGDPRAFDYIAVVGGLIDGVETLDREHEAYLRKAAEAGVPLIGVCTGAFILHRLGLMDGYRCCVSWFHHADFLDQFDGLEPISDRIFVEDRDRLTCSGGVSSAHLAARLVERHVGRSEAQKSLHVMIIDEVMGQEKAQPLPALDIDTRDELVKRALVLLYETIEQPLTIDQLSERLEVSRRKLERRFKAAIGVSPAETALRMRLERAIYLLKNTDQSVTGISADTGFYDASHFINAFRARHGVPPEEYRNRLSLEPASSA